MNCEYTKVSIKDIKCGDCVRFDIKHNSYSARNYEGHVKGIVPSTRKRFFKTIHGINILIDNSKTSFGNYENLEEVYLETDKYVWKKN